MKNSIFRYFVGAVALLLFAACNSDSYTAPTLTANGGTSVMVSKFSLMENDSILADLDSVFFSIDLDKGRIFNADSLPVGTRIKALQVEITLPPCRVASLREYGAAATDTIDYLTSSTDSIDFSKGPVTLHIVSANGEFSMDYSIEVNVHKVHSNEMTWSETAQSVLPTNLNAVTAQGTVESEGKLIVFTTDGMAACRAESVDAYAGQWNSESVTLPADADVASVVNADGTLYMICGSELYSSADQGYSWTSTGAEMSYVYGASGAMVLGVKQSGSGYVHCTYPASVETAVPEGCPVSGTSQCLTYVSEWSSTPMTMFVGGVTADGDVTGAAWAYDGGAWAKISNTSVPDMTGMTLVPYFGFRTASNTWQVTESSIIMAFGGITADGEMNTTTYVSYNRGVDWVKSGIYLTLPEKITSAMGRQAFVLPYTFESRGVAGIWTPIPTRKLPHWLMMEPNSRAVAPITQWECPFIYLFGGYDEQGELCREIWRGAINRLIFKPLQ